jgi:hypothetical protein
MPPPPPANSGRLNFVGHFQTLLSGGQRICMRLSSATAAPVAIGPLATTLNAVGPLGRVITIIAPAFFAGRSSAGTIVARGRVR